MAELKEQEYVHDVYNEIASHFSETRYKPWPIVTEFLNNQITGSIGIDVGCGNGKYLGINPNIFIIGSDRSSGLIECASRLNGSYNVMVADGMHLPHKDNTFDFAISIAVVHHWSTRERRINAIKHILSKVKAGGQALIYCWALEQGESRRGYHEGMKQDILVPWVLHETKKEKQEKKVKPEKPDLSNVPSNMRAEFIAKWREEQETKRLEEAARKKKEQEEEEKKNTKFRYYHLYKKGELEEDCISAGGIIMRTGYEKDNWYVVVQLPAI
ncbi:hypothetical protein Kpol_1023p89 [Vanderwaltozyma polyspora DSM 70294]|uniref:Methyltransferase type 11 domain-containing protein n=1 Tax=Vanderwaltozyma polyspora (strain ATCC 22028 / DSM 70294 / BCRC 21397 / CBS 2163 / NBRC 10782 / NRRL Y-8283 / UCD 57-17) TaxID=436907 RepID=A7TFW0_VANPO|nr:uncharacterized protein Kpol_1023p89 [Vanderwaltozyma polyspora DSM 70294]EDO18918.1 hypothetical protein Kpol_1023p89 [Vanderwaltozyma polyspora DSM 70294]